MNKEIYPDYINEFYDTLVNKYKMNKAIAQDCSHSFNKYQIEAIHMFLVHYSHLIELPTHRYNGRYNSLK